MRKSVSTYTATVYVGLKNRDSGRVHDIGEVERICQAYCDRLGLCVTITPTTYYYTNGREPGCIIGLINYPRFPSTPKRIRQTAFELSRKLKSALEQYRVSIVFPDNTIMLTSGEH